MVGSPFRPPVEDLIVQPIMHVSPHPADYALGHHTLCLLRLVAALLPALNLSRLCDIFGG